MLALFGTQLKENIEAIERVQKFALKVCQKDWHSDYNTLLNSANVPPLAARRKALKLCQLFSILQGHTEFPDLPTSKRVSRYLNCIRSTNSATLTQAFAHTTLFQNSFFPSTIKLWNTLPFNICTLQSLPHFKQAVSIICCANSNVPSLTVKLCTLCFYVYVLFFLCITYLSMDTRLVLTYMLSLMSGHNKFIL